MIFDEVMKEEIAASVVNEQALTAIIEGVIENYGCVNDRWRIDASDVRILIGSNLILVPKARFLFES